MFQKHKTAEWNMGKISFVYIRYRDTFYKILGLNEIACVPFDYITNGQVLRIKITSSLNRKY